MDSTVVQATVNSHLYVNNITSQLMERMGLTDKDMDWKFSVGVWAYTDSEVLSSWALRVHYKDEVIASSPKFSEYTNPYGRKVRREVKKLAKRARLLA